MKVIIKPMLVIYFLLLTISSCNNEEIFIAEESVIIEEENPNNEDEAPPIDTVDDSVTTTENIAVDIETHLNDLNLQETNTISNTNPSHGVLTINNNDTEDNLLDDSVVYTPNAGFSGIDSFKYTVCDSSNSENCDTATVSITVEPLENDFATELKAFPSAYGAGAKTTTGGRGGAVIHVTNLNDSGTGSLREALLTTGARYIVFDVSGVINLSTQIRISSSYGDFTVNGFSAPYGGITIIGHAIICSNVDNIIWRGIRFRNGYLGQTGYTNATELQHSRCEDVVVDRCSFAYADDGGSEGKGVSFVGNDTSPSDYGGNGTIQNCLFTQSKEAYMVGNSGDDNFGDVSCLRNVSTTIGHRHPKIGGVAYIDVINNISHDWNYRLIRLEAFNTVKLNLINNRFTNPVSTDPSSGAIHGYQIKSGQTPTIYEDGNIISPNSPTDYATEPWNAWFVFGTGAAVSSDAWTSTKITGISGVDPIVLDAADLKTELLPKVGACEYMDDNGDVQFYRDAIDTTAITTVDTDATGTRESQSNYRTLAEAIVMPTNTRSNLNISTGVSDYDTDADGMADVWEIAKFGNLSSTSIGDEDGDGYTNLEEFLNRVDE